MRRLGCFRNHFTLSLEPSSRRNFNSAIDSTPESFYDHLLRSCNVLSSLKQIHSSLTTSGFFTQNPHLGAQIIIKYTKYGEPNKARTLFNNLINVDNDDPSSFLWNSMLRAYANNGHIVEALDLYSLMRRNGVSVNNYTFPFVLKACASKSLIDVGHIIHSDVVRIGFYSDKYVEASLVDMYAKCGQMDDGCKVFDKMLVRDLVSWTAMITAYEQAEKPEKAIMLFKQMQLEGILVDSVTIVSLASAIGQLGDAIRAQSIHGYAISNGFLEDLCVGNTIIAMYAKCGEVEKARKVFNSIEKKDGISWNCILSGYTQNGQASEALLLFDEMLDFGCRPNPVTMLILVCACTFLGSSQLGRKIHDFIKRSNMAIDITLLNALMDMYAKCGDLDVAEIMFKGIHPSELNVSSWNVLISGYGMHGHGRKALEFYRMMEEEGVEPDHITFTSVLSACSHAGLIDEGRKCFKDMVKFNVKHEAKHYACIVDMFGRSGLLDEAFDIIKQMQSPANDAVWGALLLACRIHGNSELGEIAANNLFELEPEHAGYYVLMSNIYAMSKRWQEVGKLRRKMKNKGLKKIAAFSVIESGNEFFGFHTGDQVNPYWREVYEKVESLAVEMKMVGYVPDLSCVLHDVEEEDKEHMLIYHSEKLAVAFGIMKNHVELGMEIRVTKNLRICNDCHSAFKLISSIYGRRIIVRDANRFHHFEGGICSCKDYW